MNIKKYIYDHIFLPRQLLLKYCNVQCGGGGDV